MGRTSATAGSIGRVVPQPANRSQGFRPSPTGSPVDTFPARVSGPPRSSQDYPPTPPRSGGGRSTPPLIDHDSSQRFFLWTESSMVYASPATWNPAQPVPIGIAFSGNVQLRRGPDRPCSQKTPLPPLVDYALLILTPAARTAPTLQEEFEAKCDDMQPPFATPPFATAFGLSFRAHAVWDAGGGWGTAPLVPERGLSGLGEGPEETGGGWAAGEWRGCRGKWVWLVLLPLPRARRKCVGWRAAW